MNWKEFEDFARKKMSAHLGSELIERALPGIPKKFDMVSSDGRFVGDAKYLTLVKRINLPPAKFMEIAGHVWLLEKTKAERRFLVFGNQREVPEWWLKKYGNIVKGVDLYFLSDEGILECLREGGQA